MSDNDQRERAQNQEQAEAQIEGFRNLGRLLTHMRHTDFPSQLERRIEERSQTESEGVLSVDVERTLKIVLCTGGPHCEVTWTEGRDAFLVCYGWFGAGRYERRLDDDELAGLEHALGDLEYLLNPESY